MCVIHKGNIRAAAGVLLFETLVDLDVFFLFPDPRPEMLRMSRVFFDFVFFLGAGVGLATTTFHVKTIQHKW